MKLKSVCALAAMVSFGSAFAANTWYVDDDWYEQGGDGSQESPFGTIQQAVNAASAGDTILVAPGTYDQGSTDGYRVKIPNSDSKTNLTIRATGGRDVTFIVGRRHSDESPSGPNAIGGIWCGPSKGCTIIDGFTFRDCHRASETDSEAGVFSGGYTAQANNHLFNCAIESCSGASVYGATIHSSICTGNYAATNTTRVLFRHTNVDNCLVTKADAGGLCVNVKFVNCTIAGNAAHLYADGCYGFLNSIHSMSPELRTYAVPITNSVSSGSLSTGKAFNITNKVAATDIFACTKGFSDFRLRADSPAVGRAEPSILPEHIALPPADRDPVGEPGRYSTYHDVYGNPIDMAAEHINAGAIQETVAVDDSAVGLTTFKQLYKEPLVIDGEVFPGAEAFIRLSTTCPTQWCVTASEPVTKPLSAVQDSLADIYRVASTNGTIWVTSAPVGQTRNLTVETAQKVFYLDPNGNDAWDGLSAVHEEGTTTGPWQTFTNAAVKLKAQAGNSRTMVRCAPGTYDRGVGNNVRIPLIGGYWESRRYHFVGVAGAERTFVAGADATTADADENGCGTDAVGCIYAEQILSAGFTGFTFCNGRTTTEREPATYPFARAYGNLGEGKAQISVCECVVSNNVATNARISYFMGKAMLLERCRITKNSSKKNGLMHTAILLGSVFDDNPYAGDSRAFAPGIAVNSTFANMNYGGYAFDESSKLYNCILSDFNWSYQLAQRDAAGTVYDNAPVNAATDASKITVVKTAMYADKAGGDYRILSCSPANGAARMDGADYVKFATTDYEGNPVCRGMVPTVSGAYAKPLASGVYVDDPKNYLLVDGGKADGAHFISEGGELAIAANTEAATTCPVAGIAVDGVTNLFSGAAGTITVPFDAVKDASKAITPVLGNTWYVNAGDDPGWAPGSDANLGWGTWAPLKTLTNAMAKAKSGDVVIAAPGRYDEGVVSCEENGVPYVLKRVKVPEGVTLRSEQGAEKTFIVGAPATIDPNEYGCGTNAVGCVNLQNRSKLEGFTLTGACGHGRTDKTGASAVYGVNPASIYATQISDCIISNCTAHFGIAMYGRYTRCRIVENTISGNTLLYGTRLLNVHIDHNRFKESGDGYCYSQSAWTNVTWGAHNLTTEDKAPEWGVTPHSINAVNCIVFGKIKNNATDCTVSNCLITAGTFKNVDDPSKIMLDAEGRPLVVEGNLALDTGLTELYDAGAMGDKDASGRPRVMNAALDIGALEADWRPRYSKDIGSRVTVTEATSGIVETDGRKVSFGAGGTVSFDWLCEADQKCELSVNVTGDGVLVVTREGEEPVEYAKGEHVYAFKPTATGVQRFTLTYVPAEDDTGTAEILRAKRDIGMVLIFR